MSDQWTIPKTILLADNDDDVSASSSFMLNQAGFRVLKASSLAQGKAILTQEIVHAAVIDLRLTDNQQPEDISGFELASALPEVVPFIIFTAYQNIDNLHTALSKMGAKDVIYKHRDNASELLLSAVQNLFDKHVPVNFALKIAGSILPRQIASNIRLPSDNSSPATADDVCNVLRVLFSDAAAIEVHQLLESERARKLSQSGSVLLCAYPQYDEGGEGTPLVVKFGAVGKVEGEENNYARLIRFLGGTRLTVLENSAYSRSIGALSYRLFGQTAPGKLHHLRDLLMDPANDGQTLGWMLVNLFNETFANIHESADVGTIDIFCHYADELGIHPDRIYGSVPDWVMGGHDGLHARTIFWPELKRTLPNPVTWVLPRGQWQNRPILTRRCLCHGDLHSGNILVDQTMSLWLIDFERAAHSHFLRDLVELETDIKIQMCSDLSTAEYAQLESSLLQPVQCDPDRASQYDLNLPTGAADNVHQLLTRLRCYAIDRLGLEHESVEYYYALLMSTLYTMQLRSISVRNAQQAFLSASLIAERIQLLEHNGQTTSDAQQ